MNPRVHNKAFTLIELLVVIAIVGILAALIAPTIQGLRKGDTGLSASRQVLDAVARGRQLAISQRTTVYMVFLPTNYWEDPAIAANGPNLTSEDWTVISNLLDKQLVSYAFVSLRSLGDQPGQNVPRYLSTWQTLPAGAMFPLLKFTNHVSAFQRIFTNLAQTGGLDVYGFQTTTNIPFPRVQTRKYSDARPYIKLPYIAFNYLGQVTTEADSPAAFTRDEMIPLAYGAVTPAIHPETKVPQLGDPFIDEQPEGNSTNNYNVIHIDWLTGRPRLERQEIE